jgi:hypothetical protein
MEGYVIGALKQRIHIVKRRETRRYNLHFSGAPL